MAIEIRKEFVRKALSGLRFTNAQWGEALSASEDACKKDLEGITDETTIRLAWEYRIIMFFATAGSHRLGNMTTQITADVYGKFKRMYDELIRKAAEEKNVAAGNASFGGTGFTIE